MSPIIDLQRRLYELGRIRLGTTGTSSSGKRIPKRLSTWRLTSRSRAAIEQAAELYGGTVQPWEGRENEWELITTTDTLPIVLVPGQALSQWWELWNRPADGSPVQCIRRCDGVTETITGDRCLCTGDYDDRREQALAGKACAPTTRLSVILRDVAGVGVWRLETRGYYAAVELSGVAELLEETTRRGVLLPARLRIDQRSAIRKGAVVKFPVPTIDVDVRVDTFAELAGAPAPALAPPESAELGEEAAGLEPSYLPLEAGASAPTTLAEGRRELEAAKERGRPKPAGGRRAQEPLGARVPPPAPDRMEAPSDAPQEPAEARTEASTPPASSEPEPNLTRPQLTRLWAMLREKSIPEATIRAALRDITGQESTRAIPQSLYELVYDSLDDPQTRRQYEEGPK